MYVYCPHGGICYLAHPHSGNHVNSFCEWTEAESISREQADKVMRESAEKRGLSFLAEMAIEMTKESEE